MSAECDNQLLQDALAAVDAFNCSVADAILAIETARNDAVQNVEDEIFTLADEHRIEIETLVQDLIAQHETEEHTGDEGETVQDTPEQLSPELFREYYSDTIITIVDTYLFVAADDEGIRSGYVQK